MNPKLLRRKAIAVYVVCGFLVLVGLAVSPVFTPPSPPVGPVSILGILSNWAVSVSFWTIGLLILIYEVYSIKQPVRKLVRRPH